MPGLKARDIEELRDGNCKFHCSVNKNPMNPGWAELIAVLHMSKGITS
jgi:hypothetical protein